MPKSARKKSKPEEQQLPAAELVTAEEVAQRQREVAEILAEVPARPRATDGAPADPIALALVAHTRSTVPDAEAAKLAEVKRGLAPLVKTAAAAVAEVQALELEHRATLRALRSID